MNYDLVLKSAQQAIDNQPSGNFPGSARTIPILQADLEALMEGAKTLITLEQVIEFLDPDGEILGNDIADEFRVRTESLEYCLFCRNIVECGDGYRDHADLHETCRPHIGDEMAQRLF